MNPSSKSRFSITMALMLVAVTGSQGWAHFPWLASDQEGHALLFFSESPGERDYHLPECVAEAKVSQLAKNNKLEIVELETIEEGEFIGRKSAGALSQQTTLQTSCQYGVYHGALLNYYAKHVPTLQLDAKPRGEKTLRLNAAPLLTDVGIDLLVTWEGKPLPGADVALVDADGEQARETTDAAGKASFATQAAGLTGFIISHTLPKASGEFEGETYSSTLHYCTLTCHYTPQNKAPSPSPGKAASTAKFPELPEPIASFGAAVCDGWLYVYSGHTGTAHDHSRDNLSQYFRRLHLTGDGLWKELSMQMPLQGHALVAYDGKLYRVGGLDARNAHDADEDLHSVRDFACYDPALNKWKAMPQLPEPRSSHDAVVIGDHLYVVGGWTLSGAGEGEWIDNAWRFDLTNPTGSWEPISPTPFHRRALAAAHWQGKLVVLCGMDEDHDISQSVDCFDPATGEWSQLADLPGEGMHGFGVSAWNSSGQLYACGNEGVLYRLADDGSQWQKCAELETPRFFHRILPGGEQTILAIAGASLDQGHMSDIEVLKPTVD